MTWLVWTGDNDRIHNESRDNIL